MDHLILPLSVNCGYFDCSQFGSLKKSPRRTAPCYEIEFYLEDGLSTYLNDREIPIRKSLFLIAKPGDVRYSQLPFKTLFIKIPAEGKIAETLDALPCCFMSSHETKVRELLQEIIAVNESQEKDCFLLAGLIFSFLSLLLKDSRYADSATMQSYGYMHAAKKHIEKHYGQNITTADMAAVVGLSESRFRYLFGSTYGISPHKYLIQVRIAAAKKMLWDTDNSISQIAEKCGFGCQQYLNDIFRKNVGLTPRQYREEFAKKYSM